MRGHRNEDGQAAIMFVAFALGLMAIAALVIDGGILLAQRRSLQSLADGAARAAAMSLDEPAVRESSGTAVRLDPQAAEAAARRYLEAEEFEGSADVAATFQDVKVHVATPLKPIVSAVFGTGSTTSEATAIARPATEGP